MRRITPDLGLRLVRRSVRHLAAGREHCADCHRTPLVGERVHYFGAGAPVCELCRSGHRGDPAHSELVRHSEFGHAVKPAVPMAA